MNTFLAYNKMRNLPNSLFYKLYQIYTVRSVNWLAIVISAVASFGLYGAGTILCTCPYSVNTSVNNRKTVAGNTFNNPNLLHFVSAIKWETITGVYLHSFLVFAWIRADCTFNYEFSGVPFNNEFISRCVWRKIRENRAAVCHQPQIQTVWMF